MRLEGIDILGPGRPDITGGATRATPIPLAARPFPNVTPEPTVSSPTPARHTVRNGENLTRIVRQFMEAGGQRPANAEVYAGVVTVARANNLSNPDLIHPGQLIDLSALATPAPSKPPFGGIPVALASTPSAVVPQASAPASAPPHQPTDPLIGALPGGGPVRVSASAIASLSPANADRSTTPDDIAPLGGPGRGRGDAVLALQRLLNNTSNALQLLRGIVHPDRRAIEPAPGPWASLVAGSARLSSEYGMRKDPFTGRMAFHDGIDLAVKRGTPITAARSGVVAFSGWKSGYGNTVIIRHEDGLETLYAHASKTRVEVGERVAEGAHIADSGSSGRSTGPHLHFEVRRHGRAVDPMPYLETAPLRVAQNGN